METQPNNKSEEVLKLIWALVVLFGIAGAYIIYLSWPLLTGTTIVLKTRPVDPFDPLRGQYMAINYEIGSVPNSGFHVGETVFTSVVPDGNGTWMIKEVSKSSPGSGVFLKGKVTGTWGSTATVSYGIEQFFFEQDAQIPTRGISVQVKVDNKGNARVDSLLKDRIPVNISYTPVSLTS